MPEALFYRGMLFILLSLFSIIFLRAAFRAGLNRQFFYHSNETLWVALPIRLLLLASLSAIVVYLFAPLFEFQWLNHWLESSELKLPVFLRLAGLLIGVLSLCLFVSIYNALGKQFSTSLCIGEGHELIQHGPYRTVRHPMYSAYQMLWLAFFLLSSNWFVGLTGMLGLIYLMLMRTPREERMMEQKFGEQYRQYMANTGRYLPRLSSLIGKR